MSKYRIVMRRGTVIEADHVNLLNSNSSIYMVGIGAGKGQPVMRRIKVPGPSQCFDEFFMPITHTAPGKSCKGMHDPSHSDYVVTPKFQKVITMHAKNILSINGKPVMDVSDVEPGYKQLDFDEWTIGGVSELLEE